MRYGLVLSAAVCLAVLFAGCGGGGGGGGGGPTGDAALLLAAGPNALDTSPDSFTGTLDLAGLDVGSIDAVYDFTTPAGEPFVFDVLSRGDANTGTVRISVAHAADDGIRPAGGPETMARAGVVASASGTTRRAAWLDAQGDGFARVTMRGEIERDQVFVVEAETEVGKTTAAVRVRIGPESEINTAARPESDYPGVKDEATLYSSNSWTFGLPTIAVSGDRTSVVCYEGDIADARLWDRYEFRLQHGPDGVHGGGSISTGPDTGHWRDHEIAALYNVLAVVRSGTENVSVKLSFDRGATFAQEEVLASGTPGYFARLVQIAMAEDYTTAVLFWQPNADGTTALVLVTGEPSMLDGDESPVKFAFDEPRVLRTVAGDVAPVLLGADYSDGGDLVIGYGYSSWTSNADGTWTSTLTSRCVVIPYDGEPTDTLVEEDVVIGRDPSVSVLGSGENLRIFYAYEGRDGVRLRTSEDGGRTFSAPRAVGDESSTNPTVLAREQDGLTRVDVVYLAQGENGLEIHLAHWDDFGAGPAATYRLTTAEFISPRDLPPDAPNAGIRGGDLLPDPEGGFRIRQVAWFGYDAVLDGDDVVIVYDEETFDGYVFFIDAPMRGMDFEGGPAPTAGDAGFVPAVPPPLAEGMTEELPPPDPDHMHQLKLIRLD